MNVDESYMVAWLHRYIGSLRIALMPPVWPM